MAEIIKKDLLALNYSGTFTIEGTKGQDIDLNLIEAPSQNCSIYGVVTDGTDPIVDAVVKVFDDDGNPFCHTLTDEQGKFYFNNLAAGEYYVATVKSGYITSQQRPVTLVENSDIPLDAFILVKDQSAELTTITGIVRGNEEKRLSGAYISLLNSDEDIISATYSANDGEFAFYDVANGEYKIIATLLGYKTSLPINISITEGRIVNSANIALEVDNRTYKGTVSGVIRNSANEAVAAAFVGLYKIEETGEEKLVSVCKTNSSGEYLFGNVDEGNYMVKSKVARVIAY